MDAKGIAAVTFALQSRLEAALDLGDIAGGVHVGPLDDPSAGTAAAALFLYRVAVNAELRNAEHRLEPPSPGVAPIVHETSLPLDLHYLLTVGPGQSRDESTALRALGIAMQALNDAPQLSGLAVQGEAVRLSVDAVSGEEMSRIWNLFPTANYRTSVIYLATPVWIDPASVALAAPPVTREPHRVGPTFA